MTRDQWTEAIHDYHNGPAYNYMEMLEGILRDWETDQLDRDKALKLCRDDRGTWRENYNECLREIREPQQ